jgi:hypothetical protein
MQRLVSWVVSNEFLKWIPIFNIIKGYFSYFSLPIFNIIKGYFSSFSLPIFLRLQL